MRLTGTRTWSRPLALHVRSMFLNLRVRRHDRDQPEITGKTHRRRGDLQMPRTRPNTRFRRVPCSMNTKTYRRFSSTVPTWKKSTARIPAAWECRNCRQVGPERRGAGSMPAARRISHTVDGATAMPSFVSSPWIRRYPHSGFSFASRTTRRAMLGTVGGRPGLRRLLVSYLLAASRRCQARSVAGQIGKASAQRLRGRSRASAAKHTRSAGSYRTRPACRRSTAFSCRSTSSSASFARSPAEHEDSQAEYPPVLSGQVVGGPLSPGHERAFSGHRRWTSHRPVCRLMGKPPTGDRTHPVGWGTVVSDAPECLGG